MQPPPARRGEAGAGPGPAPRPPPGAQGRAARGFGEPHPGRAPGAGGRQRLPGRPGGAGLGLPQGVVDAIAHTHEPEGRGVLAHVVSLANRAAHRIGRGRWTDAYGLVDSWLRWACCRGLARGPAPRRRRVQQMAARYRALAVPDRPWSERPVACGPLMSMPLFLPSDDPGPSFAELLRRDGRWPAPVTGEVTVPITHGTTVRGRPLRRRRGDGRRPAGHVRQPHPPPHHGEGVPGRPPLRGRHRRRRRPGHGDGEALPAPARALREGRGQRPQPRGQGQPARPDGARQPAGGHAGPGGGADLRRLRPAPPAPAGSSRTTSPAAATRSATTPPPARAACTPAPSSSSASARA